MYRTAVACLAVLALQAAEPTHPSLPYDRDALTLIDQVDLGQADPGHRFTELPAGASTVERILDRDCRVIPNKPGMEARYMAVRLGEGKGLEAGKAYILEVDYPEDAPRTVYVINRGCDIRHGFHTGPTLGDGMKIPYVNPNNESVDYPLAGAYRTFSQYFHLHERYADLAVPRGDENPRTQVPANGFNVIIAQLSFENAPLNTGAAVSAIRLYEAPSFKDLTLELRRPPAELPQRHLFYREEMADGVIGGKDPSKRGLDPVTWYEHHAKLMKYLGFDTFCKDLLEFGHNQGWDSSKYGGNNWVYQSSNPHLWSAIVDLAAKYELNVLPMYEYVGSVGQQSIGREKRAETLNQAKKGPKGRDDYTHISWSEKANVDVTDPDFVEDLRKVLEITIADEQHKANFVGAWLRPRNSAMPISFSDRCRTAFAKDTGRNAAPSRNDLKSDKALYTDYIAWWKDQRKAFLNATRDHLRSDAFGIGDDAVLLFTADPSEAGVSIPGSVVVSDAPRNFLDKKRVDLDQTIANQDHLTALTTPRGTWGGWEWQHSVPPSDPANYNDNDGVMHTYGFNHLYTVSNPASMEAFRTPDGLAMIRHYCLNENAFQINGDKRLLGYFVMDVELAGPYSMLPDARALAYGDPRFLGYLAANLYNRGFPQYARAFNQAFLALPAVPSSILDDACKDDAVVVRSYPTEKHGTWYAIVNTGLTDIDKATITIPGKGDLTDATTGKPIKDRSGRVTVALYPGQVLAWHQD